MAGKPGTRQRYVEHDLGNLKHATLGGRLRRSRIGAGMSQRQLARRLERNASVVSRWEAGVLEPTVWDLYRLGRILRCSVCGLVAGARGPGRRWSSRSHVHRRRLAIGRALARARHAAGLTLADVVDATRIRGRRVIEIEAGRDPSLAEATTLVTLYGTCLDAIVVASLDIAAGSQRVECQVQQAAHHPGSGNSLQSR
jgi:transcriptional regulator with XRE-family HTH domain